MKPIWLLAALLLVGCDNHFNGPPRIEYGEVYDTAFVPAGHGKESGIAVTTDSDGDTHVSPTFSSVNIPARYAIVFKCQHGKFVIDKDRGEVLYKRLSRGDKVRIDYEVVYEVKDGQTNAVDFHFLDATKVDSIPTESTTEILKP